MKVPILTALFRAISWPRIYPPPACKSVHFRSITTTPDKAGKSLIVAPDRTALGPAPRINSWAGPSSGMVGGELAAPVDPTAIRAFPALSPAPFRPRTPEADHIRPFHSRITHRCWGPPAVFATPSQARVSGSIAWPAGRRLPSTVFESADCGSHDEVVRSMASGGSCRTAGAQQSQGPQEGKRRSADHRSRGGRIPRGGKITNGG